MESGVPAASEALRRGKRRIAAIIEKVQRRKLSVATESKAGAKRHMTTDG